MLLYYLIEIPRFFVNAGGSYLFVDMLDKFRFTAVFALTNAGFFTCATFPPITAGTCISNTPSILLHLSFPGTLVFVLYTLLSLKGQVLEYGNFLRAGTWKDAFLVPNISPVSPTQKVIRAGNLLMRQTKQTNAMLGLFLLIIVTLFVVIAACGIYLATGITNFYVPEVGKKIA